MSLNLNTELALINTSANSGTITLPLASSIPGRVVNFKDSVGKFGTNTLTLITSGSDTFEDGSTTKIIRESNGIIQLVASGSKWYLLTGTQQNTITASTIVAIYTSTQTISTTSATVSTLNLLDSVNSTFSIYEKSTFMYYNNLIFAGTRVAPATTLNSFRFSLQSINGLSLWIDAADTTAYVASGGNIVSVKDKSLYNNIISGASGFTINNTFNGTYPSFISASNATSGSLGYIPSFNLFNPCSIFFVGQNTGSNSGTATFPQIFSCGQLPGAGNFRSYAYCYNQTIQPAILRIASGSNSDYSTGLNTTTPQIISFLMNTTNTGLYQNGNLIINVPINGGNTTNLYIASATTTGNTWTGYFSEFIICNTLLTQYRQQQVEGYLAWKWGLQANLPANHPFKNAPP
jgi:hypothetical protein